MSENQSMHTPAPWRATERDEGSFPYAIERAMGSAVLPIADVCGNPGYKQTEANARLIAAAPAMADEGRTLATLALQSERYRDDMAFRDAVDNLIATLTHAGVWHGSEVLR